MGLNYSGNESISKREKNIEINIVYVMLLFVTATTYSADWEFGEGSMEISGMISFESRSGDLYENYYGNGPSIFILSNGFQYFIQTRISIGGNIEFESWDERDYKSRKIVLGPAMTYYFGNKNTNIWHHAGINRSSPYVGIGFMYGSENYKYRYDNTNDEFNYSSTVIQLTTGMSFNLVEHYNLKGRFYYDIEGRKSDEPDAEVISGNVFDMKIGFSGFIY